MFFIPQQHLINVFQFHLTNIFFSLVYLFTAKCKSTLGMESGAIADFQITASSAHDIGNVGPQHARYGLKYNIQHIIYNLICLLRKFEMFHYSKEKIDKFLLHFTNHFSQKVESRR